MSDKSRRDFLKKLSTGVGGIALAGSHPFLEHSETNRTKEAGPTTDLAALNSPDGRLAITFQTLAPDSQPAPAGRLVYEIAFEGKPLIVPSGLSLELEDQTPLGPSVRLIRATRSTTDEAYRLVTGKASVVRNHFNALVLEL